MIIDVSKTHPDKDVMWIKLGIELTKEKWKLPMGRLQQSPSRTSWGRVNQYEAEVKQVPVRNQQKKVKDIVTCKSLSAKGHMLKAGLKAWAALSWRAPCLETPQFSPPAYTWKVIIKH